jgi:hypothetical protein
LRPLRTVGQGRRLLSPRRGLATYRPRPPLRPSLRSASGAAASGRRSGLHRLKPPRMTTSPPSTVRGATQIASTATATHGRADCRFARFARATWA